MKYPEWKEMFVDGEEKTIKSALTLEERGAIIRYVSPDSIALNDKLRHGMELTEEEKEWIISLDRALEKLPVYKGNLNRSLTFSIEEDAKKFYDSFEIGNNYVPKQYLSATKEGIYNEEGQVQIYIQDAKEGKNLAGINDMEQEVLYQAGISFEVVNKIKKDGKFYILLREAE